MYRVTVMTVSYTHLETVLAPDYDADCNTMTTWNGTDNIKAASGQKILMVECTSGGKARKSGETTVVSKA